MLFWFHPRNTIKEWKTAGHEPKSKLELKHREWIVLLRFRRSNCSSAFSASCSTSRMNAKEADSFSFTKSPDAKDARASGKVLWEKAARMLQESVLSFSK
ncbi:unnamed protein product [Prunus armeniaca]